MTKLIVDGTEVDVPPDYKPLHASETASVRSELDELLYRFETMPPDERRRDIKRAEDFLRRNGINSLARFDEWTRT
jgi:hypothetical protein